MILGTLGAMVQKLDLKRLIAYSAIGNAGYMLLGISAGNLEGLQGLLLFAVIYIVMSVNAFATILTLRSSNCLSTLYRAIERGFDQPRAEHHPGSERLVSPNRSTISRPFLTAESRLRGIRCPD